MIEQVKKYLLKLQESICCDLESLDGGAVFENDLWTKKDGNGSGLTSVIYDGNVFEKGGVNFSIVEGKNMPKSATAVRPELQGREYTALGVSLVLHPKNPYVPTVHLNVRFFVAEEPAKDPVWWFGGGFDLTPFYGFDEDALHWHTTAKKVCLPFGEKVYLKYKKWCDDYFYLKHRDEQRGIGGLFFDDLNEGGFERCFKFMKNLGDHFSEAYLPIVVKRKDTPYGKKERDFQLYRRGRYVEFNLIYDRGTLFGLQSGGRTESILISMPPEVKWSYQFQVEKDSEEEKLYKHYLKPKEWIK